MSSRSDRRNLLKGLAFLSPWIVGFLVFTLIPIILSVYYSLCDYSLLQPPLFRGLENYRDLVHDETFWTAIRVTLVYAAVALPLLMLIALGLALLLNIRIGGQSVYRTMIFLPSLVPAVASAMLWLWLFNSKLGLINNLLAAVHIPGPEWLAGDGTWAMPAFVLMSFWGVGNTVVIYLAGLQDVPKELYEAADLDGATAVQKVLNVTLPMISPVIFFNLIMGIIGTLQFFGPAFIMTNGGPGRSTTFYTLYLYRNAFEFVKMGYASAMAWIQLLMVLALTGIAFWSSKRWVHYQGK